MRRWLVYFFILPLLSLPAGADEVFDHSMDALAQRLSFSAFDGAWRARFSGTFDLEAYFFDGPPPGLLATQQSWLWQPRGTLFFDAQAGPRLYFFAQGRMDRGFDPADAHLRGRLDEFALRLTPWADSRLNVQLGQFGTISGQWVKRHLSWQNPFISAPLFYENPSRLSDLSFSSEQYPSYASQRGNPVIWGPSYTTGIAASGQWKQFEWAAEFKNASLFSRPEYWAWWDVGFSEPTVGGRIAWRPNLQWTLGLSTSHGTFLSPSADYSLPSGHERGDYRQTLWLLDVSYAFRHLQLWAEVVHTRLLGPTLQTVENSAYFIEARYKFTPRLAGAIRWNQQSFSRLQRYGASDERWGDSMIRLDVAATWRFNAHTQIQLEISRSEGSEASQRDRMHLATRYTLRF